MTENLSSAPHDRRLSSSMIFEQDEPDRDSLIQVIRDLEHSQAQALEDYALADRECRRLRREADALRRQLAQAREEDPKAKMIREVLDHWKRALNHPKAKVPIDGARANKVRARLNQGFNVGQLKRAIDGCAFVPFVGPRGRQASDEHGAKRHDDIELICRDETTVERFIRYADEHEQPKLAGQPATAQPAASSPPKKFVSPDYPIASVLAQLWDRGCRVVAHESRPDNWSAQCPAHDDRNPSLSIHRKPDGMVLLHCWAGCATEDVLDALGLDFNHLWTGAERDHGRRDAQAPAQPIPPHLRHEMHRMLEQDERQAA